MGAATDGGGEMHIKLNGVGLGGGGLGGCGIEGGAMEVQALSTRAPNAQRPITPLPPYLFHSSVREERRLTIRRGRGIC